MFGSISVWEIVGFYLVIAAILAVPFVFIGRVLVGRRRARREPDALEQRVATLESESRSSRAT